MAGNANYSELIDVCGSSKALYAPTDARQYEEYVVTNTPPPVVVPVPPKA